MLSGTEADTIDTNADTNVAPKHPRTKRDAKYTNSDYGGGAPPNGSPSKNVSPFSKTRADVG